MAGSPGSGSHDDSGSAFPHDTETSDGSYWVSNSGLTKLEWFAGQALIGLLGKTGKAQLDGEKTAAAAFAMARFMIRESRK